jgi:oligopeptide/dipeptide ABC transporter ATP-binding protein
VSTDVHEDAAAPPVLDADDSSAILEVRDLQVTFGKRELLSSVNLSVGRGEALGIVGETGSGKTLSCRAVMGLLPRLGGRITGGEIVFEQQRLTQLSEPEWHALRGRRLALVPQSSLSGLDPVMTVGRQLTETVRYLDPDADPSRRAIELLERVEMPRAQEVLRSHAHQLSGGMRQRAMIALAIVGNPAVLIADEPTTALDVTVQRAILDLLADLRKQLSMSLVIVTHDLSVIEAVTDRVAIMYAGLTCEFGLTRVVLDKPRHPYTRALLATRPALHQIGTRLTVIGGTPPSPDDWPPGCRFAPRCPHVLDRCVIDQPSLVDVSEHGKVACVRHDELIGS